MVNNFKSLSTYNNYIASEIGIQMRDYTRYLDNAKKVSERKMWAKQIEYLNNEFQMANFEFQPCRLK